MLAIITFKIDRPSSAYMLLENMVYLKSGAMGILTVTVVPGVFYGCVCMYVCIESG